MFVGMSIELRLISKGVELLRWIAVLLCLDLHQEILPASFEYSRMIEKFAGQEDWLAAAPNYFELLSPS